LGCSKIKSGKNAVLLPFVFSFHLLGPPVLTRKAKMKTMEEYKLQGEGEKPNTKIYNGKESWVLIP